MKRFAALSDVYLALVMIFLLLQTQVTVQVDAHNRGWQGGLEFVVSIVDVVAIVSGGLLRLSGAGWQRGRLRACWHLAVLLLVSARIAFAYELHRVSLGQESVTSHLWILAAVGIGVLTIVHYRAAPAAAPAPVQPASADASALGKYEIRGLLGQGAMGRVYEAFDPHLARRVAIKVVERPTATDRQAVEAFARFQREAQAVGRLHHPNIVAVHDYGETATCAYIVMELIDGQSVAALLETGRPTLPETLRLMHGLLAGLQHSHECGIVHRDIKPANIMLGRDGALKITDFGVAHTTASELTVSGDVVGTAACMAPEQFLGEAIDARVDIYASGILFYRLLTGQRPFDGSMASIMNQVLTCPPPAPSQSGSGISPCFDAVVSRAMARRPEDRYATAAAFAAAIRGVAPSCVAEVEATRIVARSAA